MPNKTTKPRVSSAFYAWQNDSANETNRYFIREALKKALKALRAKNSDWNLTYDEATRNVAGSVLIVDSILTKIDACDVVVADISLIGNVDGRPVPNPNVAFEVGWAAARLGWHRVVLVFNQATGKIEDVPFDLRGRSTLSYAFDGDSGTKKAAEQALVAELVRRIGLALNSPKPVRGLSRTRGPKHVSPQQQRDRDRQALYELLGRLNSDWMDFYIGELGLERIPDHDETHYEMVAEVVESARFRVFDRKTDKAIREFKEAFGEMIEHSRYGDHVVGTKYARFRPEMYANGKQIDNLRERYHDGRQKLAAKYRALVDQIHTAFPEFDLGESDQRALEFFNSLGKRRLNKHAP